jgi:type I restriction enzyme S subunit
MINIEDVARINAKSLNLKTGKGKTFHYIDLAAVNEGEINFPSETIEFSELPSRARRVLRKGDVIMATVRPNLLAYAVCDFEPKDVLCSTGFALISPKNKLDSQFIYQNLFGDLIQRQIHSLVTGSNYPAINSSEVARLVLAWPTQEQERYLIAQTLQTCDEEIQLLQQKQGVLQQQKKGLMQRLLTGQIRVNTPHFPGNSEFPGKS